MQRALLLIVAMLAFGLTSATGQGKLLTNDPLTGLPLFPGTDSGMHLGNQPDKLPGGLVCKSKMQGNFYTIFKTKTNDVVAWYSSHLAGFQKVSGYDSRRAQIAFRNSDGTILVIVTGEPGAKGENTAAYTVAYERFQPGISNKTFAALPLGNIDCRN